MTKANDTSDSLTPEESFTLVAAMLEAKKQGLDDSIQVIADLAKDPAKLREILKGSEKKEEKPKPSKKAPSANGSLKKSPFKK